jgi:hypothetical protein
MSVQVVRRDANPTLWLSLQATAWTTSVCSTLQRHNAEIFIFLEKELRRLSPSFHIYVSVSDLYIPTIGLPFLLQTVIRFV